jgi:hypothetical protein
LAGLVQAETIDRAKKQNRVFDIEIAPWVKNNASVIGGK